MRFLENMRLSLRYVRMRFLESALAVVGTTIGVAIIAAAVTLIQAYNAEASRELSSPTFRFIDIQAASAGAKGDVPLVRLGSATDSPPELQLSDIEAIRAEVPAADYVFANSRELAGGSTNAVFSYTTSKAVGGSLQKGGGAVVKSGSFVAAAPEAAGASVMSAGPGAGGPGAGGPGAGGPAAVGPGPAGAVTFSGAPVFDQPALTETLTPLVDEFDLVRLTGDGFAAFGATLARGSFFTAQDQQKGTPVMVLGAALAHRMFGDADPVGGRFRKNGIVWTVVGVLNPMPYTGPEKGDANQWAFAPFQQPALRLPNGQTLRLPDRVRTITVGVKDPAHLRAALAQVTAYITRHYGPDAYAARANFVEAEQSLSNHTRLFVVIGFLAGAALLISSITLLNLMTTRTLRRSRSIGIFRSLGARRGDVFSIFLGESLALTLLGGLLGAALAPLLYQVLLKQVIPASWGVNLGGGIDALLMAAALLGAVALNLVFSLLPALQAARTNVVEAIRAE